MPPPRYRVNSSSCSIKRNPDCTQTRNSPRMHSRLKLETNGPPAANKTTTTQIVNTITPNGKRVAPHTQTARRRWRRLSRHPTLTESSLTRPLPHPAQVYTYNLWRQAAGPSRRRGTDCEGTPAARSEVCVQVGRSTASRDALASADVTVLTGSFWCGGAPQESAAEASLPTHASLSSTGGSRILLREDNCFPGTETLELKIGAIAQKRR